MSMLHLGPIAVTGVVASGIIFERVKNLFFSYNIDSKKFISQIDAMLSKGNLQGALDLCASHDKALLPHVIKAALLKATRDEKEIRTEIEVALLDCSGKIGQRIGYLAMIANVATLLGLLGTIAGLIASFEAVASADPATKQSLLASGISTSMNATALGLVVAIPVMVAYSALNAKATRILDELEKGAGRVLAILHGRLYLDESEDFSKLSFESVQEGKSEKEKEKLKGAA